MYSKLGINNADVSNMKDAFNRFGDSVDIVDWTQRAACMRWSN